MKPMYKISQDHLEMLFGNIRSHGGANNHPTARQFKAAYKNIGKYRDKGSRKWKLLGSGTYFYPDCASSSIERINKTTNNGLIENGIDMVSENNDDEDINLFFQNISDFSQQITSHIAQTGLTVVATICDQGASNLSAINSLLNDTKEHYLQNNCEYREGFFEIGGSKACTAKWDHIIALFKRCPGYSGVKLVSKLSAHHVLPELIPKMRRGCHINTTTAYVTSGSNEWKVPLMLFVEGGDDECDDELELSDSIEFRSDGECISERIATQPLRPSTHPVGETGVRHRAAECVTSASSPPSPSRSYQPLSEEPPYDKSEESLGYKGKLSRQPSPSRSTRSKSKTLEMDINALLKFIKPYDGCTGGRIFLPCFCIGSGTDITSLDSQESCAALNGNVNVKNSCVHSYFCIFLFPFPSLSSRPGLVTRASLVVHTVGSHILVDSPVAEIPLSLLVDSGSAVCLLKHSSISKHPRLIKEPIKLKGIDPGDEPTTTEVTEELCKQTRIIEITSTCYNNLKPLIVRFQDMSRELTSISHLIDNRTKRSAWISGAGTILKKIFGTLDENDGLQYDEAIKTLQLNEKKLASLIKENILVTTSVLTQYNATLSKIVENEANSKEAIDKLSANIRNITEMTNGLQIQASVNEVINALETSILTLSFQLEDIINAILFSSQNILHPAIATPTQLHKELADNYRHLPSDLELPVSLDIKSIHIILIISLILPDYKYLAMTKDKSFYCAFNSLEICKTVTPGNYICDIENVYSTETKPICESELLTKPEPELEMTDRQTDCEDSTPNMSNIAPLRITI
ncbi:hypothetical protein HW555_009976 [Spodoptera exigua]|uniref:Transposable element P transposase-like RNase H C-terminal domain-containing protein n=1 Tax=Spodoptera exigua TaxID=7107 RepID=A0A835L081_SPOEX|nr:hypothetical protein HW555_009976 [Spodoptera exigua]